MKHGDIIISENGKISMILDIPTHEVIADLFNKNIKANKHTQVSVCFDRSSEYKIYNNNTEGYTIPNINIVDVLEEVLNERGA